mgnify:CR=1 FL=1
MFAERFLKPASEALVGFHSPNVVEFTIHEIESLNDKRPQESHLLVRRAGTAKLLRYLVQMTQSTTLSKGDLAQGCNTDKFRQSLSRGSCYGDLAVPALFEPLEHWVEAVGVDPSLFSELGCPQRNMLDVPRVNDLQNP